MSMARGYTVAAEEAEFGEFVLQPLHIDVGTADAAINAARALRPMARLGTPISGYHTLSAFHSNARALPIYRREPT